MNYIFRTKQISVETLPTSERSTTDQFVDSQCPAYKNGQNKTYLSLDNWPFFTFTPSKVKLRVIDLQCKAVLG